MARRVLALAESHPGRTIAAVGILFALAYSTAVLTGPRSGSRLIVGDAVHYYVYLRSAVFDRDLHFRNEYVTLYGLKGGEAGTEWVDQPTATGRVRNLMSIGPSLAWAPLYLLVTAGVAAARVVGSTYPLDGYGSVFQASAGLSGIAAATIGAWLSWRLCRRFFDARTALWSTLAVWLGSHALYYSLISPAYSHASSMLAVSGFFYAWATSIDRQSPRRYAIVGALAGLSALIRWQDAVLLVVPLTDAFYHALFSGDRQAGASAAEPASGTHSMPGGRRARERWRSLAVNLSACGAAALVSFAPQMAAWLVLYGRPVIVPQGGSFMQWTRPHLLSVLFSDWHGLFTWTPIVALCAVGLVPLWRCQRVLALGVVAALIASWYVNAAVADWWAGEAFGARRFVSCFPVFVVGFAALIEPIRTRTGLVAALVAALVSSNMLLLFQYQLFMHGWRHIAPYPRGLYGLVVARFVVPFDFILQSWSR